MKGTYDFYDEEHKPVVFSVIINNKTIPFESVMGFPAETSDHYLSGSKFDLRGYIIRSTGEAGKTNVSREDKIFVGIPTKGHLTFEDAIESYMVEKFQDFDSSERFFAACFLERYCMSYEEVKNMIKKL